MKLRSLRGKVFLATSGTVGYGDSFSYDPETGRLYKRVGDDHGGTEMRPQLDLSKTPAVPSFVEEVYVLDESYEPHPAVVAHSRARRAYARASWAVVLAQDALRELGQ